MEPGLRPGSLSSVFAGSDLINAWAGPEAEDSGRSFCLVMDIKSRIWTEPESLFYLTQSSPEISTTASHLAKLTLAFGAHNGTFPSALVSCPLRRQIPEDNNSEGGILYFGPQFQRF